MKSLFKFEDTYILKQKPLTDETLKDFNLNSIFIDEKTLNIDAIIYLNENLDKIIGFSPIQKKSIQEQYQKTISVWDKNKKTALSPPVEGKNILQEVNSMTYLELQTNHPDLFNKILGEGKKTEHDRVIRLIGWDATPESRKIAKEAIINYKTQEDVLSQLMEASKSKVVKSNDSETVADIPINTGSDNDLSKDADKNSLIPTKDDILKNVGVV
jgi:hypothetical protein